MPVQVFLSGEILCTTTPDHLAALMEMAATMGLSSHPDPESDTLYIDSPLAGRYVGLLAPSSRDARALLQRRLEGAGAGVLTAGSLRRPDLWLVLRPGGRVTRFSLRRPLASWRLARSLAQAFGGNIGFTPWLSAPHWQTCAAVATLPELAPEDWAAQIVFGLLRFYAPAPAPAAIANVLTAAARRAVPASPPLRAAVEPSGTVTSAAKALPPTVPTPAAPPPAAPSPSATPPATVGGPTGREPLVLGDPVRAHPTLAAAGIVPPMPPPLLQPPGGGPVRVFTPQLASPVAATPLRRPLPLPTAGVPFRLSVQRPVAASAAAARVCSPGRPASVLPALAAPPPYELCRFHPTPASPVPG